MLKSRDASVPEPFVLGVNYWPRRKAMYWWSQFDPGEVRDEFALIHELGLGLVRIFLLWDDFQPTPDRVSHVCLDRLATVCDIAAESGLKLDVTFFTGHMSGPNWAPGWLLDGRPRRLARQLVSGGQVVQRGYRNPFTDPLARQAERLLLSTVVGALRDHPAIGLWNLGNEPDLFAWPPNAAAGRAWVREMTQLIHTLDSRHPVTCGLHVANLLQDNGLRVTEVFAETDVAVMHAYPMYGMLARSPLDPDFVPFTCALTAALCGKPVLMEEFGGCTAPPGRGSYMWRWLANHLPRVQFMASEEAMAEYLVGVLPRLVAVGATGAVLWCFADYAAELWDRPPCDLARHERHFGLVRPDGSLKPHAQVLKDFAATHPMVQKPARQVALPFMPARFYSAAGRNTLWLYRAFAQ
jgi:endo-1,4-beta-mannosidase